MRRKGRAEGRAEGLLFRFYATKPGVGHRGELHLAGVRSLPVSSYFPRTITERSRFRFLVRERIFPLLSIDPKTSSWAASAKGLPVFSHAKTFHIYQDGGGIYTYDEGLPPRHLRSVRAALVLPPMTRALSGFYVFPGLVEATQQVLELVGAKNLKTSLRSVSTHFMARPVSHLKDEELVQLDELLEEGVA